MYTLMLQRSFIAMHRLVGGDWGPENELHSHPYRVEVRLTASELDQHGYLIDLDNLQVHLDECVERFQDTILNELPEMADLNPSIENFARIFFFQLAARLQEKKITRMEVRIWENDQAWASYSENPACISA